MDAELHFHFVLFQVILDISCTENSLQKAIETCKENVWVCLAYLLKQPNSIFLLLVNFFFFLLYC